MSKKKRKRMYEFSCEVEGHYDGIVYASSASEARELAESDVNSDNLEIVGKIEIHRH